jgi:hypothetical protein
LLNLSPTRLKSAPSLKQEMRIGFLKMIKKIGLLFQSATQGSSRPKRLRKTNQCGRRRHHLKRYNLKQQRCFFVLSIQNKLVYFLIGRSDVAYNNWIISMRKKLYSYVMTWNSLIQTILII